MLIADDHPLTREGLAMAAKAAYAGAEIDAAGNIGEAEALIAQHPDSYRFVLLDLILPDARGFSGFLKLQHMLGATPIAIVSAEQRPELVAAARALDAAGYLSKAQPLDALVESLRAMLAGRTAFPPETAPEARAGSLRNRIAQLSGAQLKVLLALADGRLNKELAGELGVTEATVKAHLTAIFRKLGVTNRTQAILAMQPLLGRAADGTA